MSQLEVGMLTKLRRCVTFPVQGLETRSALILHRGRTQVHALYCLVDQHNYLLTRMSVEYRFDLFYFIYIY